MNERRFTLRDDAIRDNCTRFIGALNLGQLWDVTITQHKRNRSRAQNALYWMWLNVIGHELGYDKDDLHAVLAAKFLGYQPEPKVVLGIEVWTRQSTRTLAVAEFTQYLQAIERFAAGDLGIMLPHPADYAEAMGR